jgi:hypothetical protein
MLARVHISKTKEEKKKKTKENKKLQTIKLTFSLFSTNRRNSFSV